MSATRICNDCGAELPTDTMDGLCPRCLFGVGAELSSLAQIDTGGFAPPKPVAENAAVKHPRRFGNYEVLAEIASGGMGMVYKARQIHLNRIVALKTLPFGRFTQDTVVQRFRAEAEAAAKLRHPQIVAIHEVGEHDGQPYFSMDFVDGPSLAQIIQGQPLEIPRAVRFVRTIAEAVHYAHSMGILHRDLKSSNIVIGHLDQPHITDFGLAKDLLNETDLTLPGQTLGSPNYISRNRFWGRVDEPMPGATSIPWARFFTTC